MTGFGLRQILINFGTGPLKGLVTTIMSSPGSHRPEADGNPHPEKWSKFSEKSNPAQNALPAPRNMITRTSRSAFATANACSISSGMGGLIVLNFSGRLSVIVPTRSFFSKVIVS
jgi:hypothetical protein